MVKIQKLQLETLSFTIQNLQTLLLSIINLKNLDKLHKNCSDLNMMSKLPIETLWVIESQISTAAE